MLLNNERKVGGLIVSRTFIIEMFKDGLSDMSIPRTSNSGLINSPANSL
jgi:hypothetical protein